MMSFARPASRCSRDIERLGVMGVGFKQLDRDAFRVLRTLIVQGKPCPLKCVVVSARIATGRIEMCGFFRHWRPKPAPYTTLQPLQAGDPGR